MTFKVPAAALACAIAVAACGERPPHRVVAITPPRDCWTETRGIML